MSQKFYSNYVGHCLRFYARYPKPQLETEANRLNWLACDYALQEFLPNERQMLLDIYSGEKTIAENVCNAARLYGVERKSIWNLIKHLEHTVADIRGLI